MTQTPPPSGRGPGVKPVLSLKRHYKLSMVVFLLFVLLGLPIVWVKGQSTYSTEAVFQVSPRYMKNLEADLELELQSNSQYRQFVNHLQNTVVRYDVVEKAVTLLENKGLDDRPSGLTRREHIERLRKRILPLAIPDTYMVRVRLEGDKHDRPYLHIIVNTLMEAFLETSKSEQIYGSEERLLTLASRLTALRAEIEALESTRVGLADQLGLTTFRDGVTNPYDIIMLQMRERLTNATVERERAEAAHRAFVDRREVPTDLGRSMLEIRRGDPQVRAQRTTTRDRIEKVRKALDRITNKHPDWNTLTDEILTLERSLAESERAFDRATYANIETRLMASVQKQRAMEAGIRAKVDELEHKATDFAHHYQNAMAVTRAIDERLLRSQQIQKRLNYLETESNALGFVRLVTPALPAEMPMGLGKKKLLIMLMLAAMAAAVAVPIGLDLLDRRVHNVSHVEKLLDIPAAGWQIRQEDLPTKMFAAEQSRRFAAALTRNHARTQRNVYAFTSVKMRGGTTSTVLDTARTLTELGARVLIVEANAFNRYTGFATFYPGVSEVLRAETNVRSAIHLYEHRNIKLEVLGVGEPDGHGLPRIDRMCAMVDELTADYEYILFDLPPVLLSADAEMLLERLGQVFLVVACESVVRDEIMEAKRLLQRIDPDAVGLFVNAVPMFRGTGSGDMEETVYETLTRTEFSRFVAGAYVKLQFDMLRTRWALRRRELLRRRTAEPRARQRHERA